MPLSFKEFKAQRQNGLNVNQIIEKEKNNTLPKIISPDMSNNNISSNFNQTNLSVTPVKEQSFWDKTLNVVAKPAQIAEKFGEKILSPLSSVFHNTANLILQAGAVGGAGLDIAISPEKRKILFEGNTQETQKAFPFLQDIDETKTNIIKKGIGRTVGASVESISTAMLVGAPIPINIPAPEWAKESPKLWQYAKYGLRGASFGGTFSFARAAENNKKVIPEIIKGMTTGSILSIGIPAALEGTIWAISNVVSSFTNAPKEAIQYAFENPEKVGNALKEYTQNPENKLQIIDKFQDSITNVIDDKNIRYETKLKEIDDMVKIMKNGNIYVLNPETNVLERTNFSLLGVKKVFTQTLNSIGAEKVSPGIYNFSGAAITNAQGNKLNELAERIEDWNDITPTGMNQLRKIIDSYRSSEGERQFNFVIDKLRDNTNNYVSDRMPLIGEMNKEYTNSMEFLKQLKQDFGNPNLPADSKLNRLLSIFNPSKLGRMNTMEELEALTGVDLRNEIVGALLSDTFPKNFVQNLFTNIFKPLFPAFIKGGSALNQAPQASQRIIAPVIQQAIKIISPK